MYIVSKLLLLSSCLKQYHYKKKKKGLASALVSWTRVNMP